MSSKIIIAAAGSGKTTYIINSSSETSQLNTAVLTFTNENEENIKERFLNKFGFIPCHIEVQSWFAFLLEHGARPYQGKLRKEKITGLHLVSGKSGFRYKSKNGGHSVYWAESDTEKYYFNSKGQIYSDKLAKFVVSCNTESGGAVFRRIAGLFNVIYIDEVQDLAGYDYEILKLLLKNGIAIQCVGDPRQTTYRTHYDNKHKNFNASNLHTFLAKECKKIPIIHDTQTLNASYRNPIEIIQLSSALYPSLVTPRCNVSRDSRFSGVYYIPESHKNRYLDILGATQLQSRKDAKGVSISHPRVNFGKSKGCEFDYVLIFPTKDMFAWLKLNSSKLKEQTRSQLYVALTRAKFGAAVIIPDKEFDLLPDTESIDEISLKRIYPN
jgi:DNA helicase-2/ATP-dependent DNA helicase PcrA